MLDINVFFQEIANPFMDMFFLLISMLTNEYLYIGIIAVIYFSINKEKAIRMALLIMTNLSFNFLLKDIFKVERPYMKNKDIINKDPDTGYGYSFPSGHSQFNSGFFTSLGCNFNIIKFIFYIILFLFLVALSRVYLGVHSVLDVCAGLIIGFVITYFMNKIIIKIMYSKKYLLYLFSLLGIFNIVISKNTDSMKILILYLGFVSGYIAESSFVNYKVPESIKRKIINILVFLLGVIIIQLSFSPLPDKIRIIKYFLIGFWASYLCPLITVERKVKK